MHSGGENSTYINVPAGMLPVLPGSILPRPDLCPNLRGKGYANSSNSLTLECWASTMEPSVVYRSPLSSGEDRRSNTAVVLPLISPAALQARWGKKYVGTFSYLDRGDVIGVFSGRRNSPRMSTAHLMRLRDQQVAWSGYHS